MNKNQTVPAKLVLGGEWRCTGPFQTWRLYVAGIGGINAWYNAGTKTWIVRGTDTEITDPGVEGLRAAMHIAEVMVMTGAI